MKLDDVKDHISFAQFVADLRAELDDPALSKKWENIELRCFLDAMEAWANDWREPANANAWRHAAEVIVAATIYE